MKEIIDRTSLEPLGYEYSDQESETIVTALDLYVGQLRKGNIPLDYEGQTVVEDVEFVLSEIIYDFNAGSRVVIPKVNEALMVIVLPFLCQLDEGIPLNKYTDLCDFLEIKPIDLLIHAKSARDMINQGSTLIGVL